jgi:hypothetical protein
MRNNSALILAALMLLGTPVAAQQRDRTQGILDKDIPEARPRTSAECRAYAIQKSNEEYLAQDSSVRRNSPFQSGPPGMRDPWADSQRQQLSIDRAGREQQLYDACLEWLRQQ